MSLGTDHDALKVARGPNNSGMATTPAAAANQHCHTDRISVEKYLPSPILTFPKKNSWEGGLGQESSKIPLGQAANDPQKSAEKAM